MHHMQPHSITHPHHTNSPLLAIPTITQSKAVATMDLALRHMVQLVRGAPAQSANSTTADPHWPTTAGMIMQLHMLQLPSHSIHTNTRHL